MEWPLGVTIIGVLLAVLVAKIVNLATAHSPSRLLRYLRNAGRFRIFIGLPIDRPARWALLTKTDRQCATLIVGKQSYVLAQVRAYLVATKAGELIADLRPFTPLPKGVHAEGSEQAMPRATLDETMLASGQDRVTVTFDRNADGAFCAIHVRNVSRHRVRIIQYGCYRHEAEQYRLATNTGAFFDGEDFCHWFRQTGLWLPPDQQVNDPHAPWVEGRLWAFFCQHETGEEFISGAIMSQH